MDQIQQFGDEASFDAYIQQVANQAPELQGQGGGGGGETAMAEATSITNNQEGGVDEGGIVKAHGDHLVILRQGRLFSVGIDGQMTPISFVDVNADHMTYQVATSPGYTLRLRAEPNTDSEILAQMASGACLTRDQTKAPTADGKWMPVIYQQTDPEWKQFSGWASTEWIAAVDSCDGGYFYGNAWYDEMLISGDTIIVVGFNYQVSATELNLFTINNAGQLSRVANGRYYLRSNDYFSGENYASRLIGNKLLFYMPYSLLQYNPDYYLDNSQPQWIPAGLPALRHGFGDWGDLVNKAQIYMPMQDVTLPVLHTVVSCDLVGASMSCSAAGAVGTWSRNFYVAPDAVYLWLNSGDPWGATPTTDSDAVVFRMPVDGGLASAVRAEGMPEDQFSFKQSDDALNVIVRRGGWYQWSVEADPYWNRHAGPLDLLTIPLSAFGIGAAQIPDQSYVRLIPVDTGWSVENRFVGDWVLVAAPYNDNLRNVLYARNHRTGQQTYRLVLPHRVERLDILDTGAIAIGSMFSTEAESSTTSDLGISSITLGGMPTVADTYTVPNAAQSESRSHAYGYSNAMRLMGLPIRDVGSYEWGTARMIYINVAGNLELSRAGDLAADPQTVECETSCYDWYGNSRPIFYNHQGVDRMFALMGYEIVEGRVQQSADDRYVQEIGRIAFSSILDQ